MTYPSVVLYGLVESKAVPPGTFPVEMFVDNTQRIDETELTIYISSLEDPSLCPEGTHCFTLIGPSFTSWPSPRDPAYRSDEYRRKKEVEARRMLALVDRRFPGFSGALKRFELATPATIERYLLKPGGCVAGPKQAIGQELMRRPHAATRWPGLFLAGSRPSWVRARPPSPCPDQRPVALRERGMKEYRAYRQPRDFASVREGPLPRRPEPRDPPDTASLCQMAGPKPSLPSRLSGQDRYPGSSSTHGDGELPGSLPLCDGNRGCILCDPHRASMRLLSPKAVRIALRPQRFFRFSCSCRGKPLLAGPQLGREGVMNWLSGVPHETSTTILVIYELRP